MAERFISPVAPPEGLTRELLTILVEECAEVQQRATKALRFGVEEIQPGQPHDNGYRLGLEVGDLLEVIRRLIDMHVTPETAIDEGQANKRRQLAKFLQSDARAAQEGASQNG